MAPPPRPEWSYCSLLSPETDTLVGSLYAVPIGVGLGCLIQNTVLITRTSVEPRDMGAAMGVGSLARTLGSGIGVALFGALYASRLGGTLIEKIGAEDAAALVSSGTGDTSRSCSARCRRRCARCGRLR